MQCLTSHAGPAWVRWPGQIPSREDRRSRRPCRNPPPPPCRPATGSTGGKQVFDNKPADRHMAVQRLHLVLIRQSAHQHDRAGYRQGQAEDHACTHWPTKQVANDNAEDRGEQTLANGARHGDPAQLSAQPSEASGMRDTSLSTAFCLVAFPPSGEQKPRRSLMRS